MEPVCFDIMEMIGKEYNNIKETIKNKKIYGEIIQHLDHYFFEYKWEVYPFLQDPDSFTISMMKEYIKEGNIRIDTLFLEEQECWETSHYKIICDKYGGKEKYDEWCDMYY